MVRVSIGCADRQGGDILPGRIKHASRPWQANAFAVQGRRRVASQPFATRHAGQIGREHVHDFNVRIFGHETMVFVQVALSVHLLKAFHQCLAAHSRADYAGLGRQHRRLGGSPQGGDTPSAKRMDDMTDLKHFIAEHNIDEVECVVPDLSGIARGKILPANKFLKAAKDGSLRVPEEVYLTDRDRRAA